MSDPIHFDAARNLLTIGDRRIVFHCHHYNVFLQRTLDEGLGARAADIQQRAASEASRAVLSAAISNEAGPARVTRAASLFGALGFGRANLAGLGAHGGNIVLETSHYAIGWRAKFGVSERPVCHFAAGFWAAAMSVAYGHAPERIVVREIRCAACVESSCDLHIEVL